MWGINLYHELKPSDFIEFDLPIDIRYRQNNISRAVEDEATRE